jgi:hypothetical protein
VRSIKLPADRAFVSVAQTLPPRAAETRVLALRSRRPRDSERHRLAALFQSLAHASGQRVSRIRERFNSAKWSNGQTREVAHVGPSKKADESDRNPATRASERPDRWREGAFYRRNHELRNDWLYFGDPGGNESLIRLNEENLRWRYKVKRETK